MHSRPLGVTILAVLAGLAAVMAAIHTLQFLGILPFIFGGFSFHTANLFYALMWGLLVWVYIWLVRMLWNMEPEAWVFLVIITIFNLTLDFIAMLGSPTFQDVSMSILINGLILIYCVLPNVRHAFGMSR